MQYLKDLTPACIAGESNYGERKAAREKEILSLNNAKKQLKNAFMPSAETVAANAKKAADKKAAQKAALDAGKARLAKDKAKAATDNAAAQNAKQKKDAAAHLKRINDAKKTTFTEDRDLKNALGEQKAHDDTVQNIHDAVDEQKLAVAGAHKRIVRHAAKVLRSVLKAYPEEEEDEPEEEEEDP